LPKLLGLNDLDKNNNDLQSNSENLVLTEIETQVAKSNAFQRARMIKQSQKKKKKKKKKTALILSLQMGQLLHYGSHQSYV